MVADLPKLWFGERDSVSQCVAELPVIRCSARLPNAQRITLGVDGGRS